MKEIIAMIFAIIGIFSTLGTVVFYVKFSNSMINVIEGDPDAVEEVTELVVDKTVSTVESEISWGILAALASMLTGLIAGLKSFLK